MAEKIKIYGELQSATAEGYLADVSQIRGAMSETDLPEVPTSQTVKRNKVEYGASNLVVDSTAHTIRVTDSNITLTPFKQIDIYASNKETEKWFAEYLETSVISVGNGYFDMYMLSTFSEIPSYFSIYYTILDVEDIGGV